MGRKKINKIVGTISHEIAEKYRLYNYEGQEIVQSIDLYAHAYKHIKDFSTIDSYNYAISNIDKIINDPIFVYYDRKRKSLSYFCEFEDNVCLVVKLKLKENDDNYVATMYPVNKNKINRLKEKSYIIEDEEELVNN